MSHTIDTLVNKVTACQRACNQCYDACLKEDDLNMMVHCIRTDRDCADICGMVISFADRESVVFNDLVALCAKMCNLCATECEKHEHMEHCQECAVACRECESACQEYLA